MLTLLVAIGSFLGFIVAYHTYGKWLARKIFVIDPNADVPSHQLRDDVDFVPTRKEVIFGHHFTSIAGTGPIVGPAIAVFWGWLPALLWVIFGSIFIGAVHDFGALIVSLRNRGQTVGEVAGRMIAPRTKVLFLLVLFFALTVVLAIFGLVIASIFNIYPESVLSVWLAMPIAVGIGFWVFKYGGSLLWPSIGALLVLYGAIYAGMNWPISIPETWGNSTVIWTLILFVYCFLASVLPVWVLLQPRDYINSHQLIVALTLLVAGLFVAGLQGQADLMESTPAITSQAPVGAPPVLPFLFITIACGAVSGFHCLVSSGTSSKQVASEGDAQYVGYGAMLLEGALAVIVILACCAGVGMGQFQKTDTTYRYLQTDSGEPIQGRTAWEARYNPEGKWSDFKLGEKVGAFVDGGANFLHALGIPLNLAVGIIAVLVACFAATTLDTATRLQRYVVQELASTFQIQPLTNKYAATLFAVALALSLAMMRGPSSASGEPAAYGTGGLLLWPLFGATNQLLAGLAFMVMVFYLHRRNKPIWFAIVPMIIMVVLPFWAMMWQLFNPTTGWWHQENYLLVTIGGATITLQLWMVAEAILAWPRAKGVLEDALPPLPPRDPSLASGRSC